MTDLFKFAEADDSPGFLLWQTTITWQRLIKKELEKFNISHAQFVILAITLWLNSKNENTTQMLIVKLSKLDKMTVSQSLKKLTDMDLIKRSEDESDTRVKKIFLTKKGNNLASKLIPIVENIDSNFFDKLQKPNLNKLKEILKNLIKD